MQHLSSIPSDSPASLRASELIHALRLRIQHPDFLLRHRRKDRDFTRKRKVVFPFVLLFILQKSLKSLQTHLHEFLGQWNPNSTPSSISTGALTRARAKLRSSAFSELNKDVLLPLFYRPDNASQPRLWHNHRLLAIDSSLIRLPNTTKLGSSFGVVHCANKCGKSTVRFPQARISVLYDVLNDLGCDALIKPHKTAETQMAQDHLDAAEPGDLILCDRGYAGIFWFILQQSRGQEFVVRCSKGSFLAVQELFKRDQEGVSCEVELEAAADMKPRLRKAGLKNKIRVRLITLRLNTGELEVLATSLLDTKVYPTEEFADLYHLRWGIETYYHRLKARLDLENWTGKTKISILQDFQAAVFLSNLESVISEPAEEELAQATAHRKHQTQLNRAVGFHTIKHKILELLAGHKPVNQVLKELGVLFKANPVCVRPNRKVPRRETPTGQAYQFQRNVRKIVF